MPYEEILETMLRFGFARRFNDDLFDAGDFLVVGFPPFCSSLVDVVFNHYRGSPNNIRLYQEERVVRIPGLDGFCLKLTPFLSRPWLLICIPVMIIGGVQRPRISKYSFMSILCDIIR